MNYEYDWHNAQTNATTGFLAKKWKISKRRTCSNTYLNSDRVNRHLSVMYRISNVKTEKQI